MTLTEMTKAANAYTDENFKAITLLYFVNEAIGTINAEINCNLPFITGADDNYVALSETWIRQVLIPYLCYSIKLNDGSLSEASMFMRSYEQGLKRLTDNKFDAISETYRSSDFSRAYQIDYTTNLYNTFGLGSLNYIAEAYDPYSFYYEGESVSYNRSLYRAIKDTKGNLPTDTNFWRLMS